MTIWHFLDYRAFLRWWLAEHRRTSLRTLARRIGFSPSLLSRILAGERELDPTRAGATAAALRLTKDEAVYFADLVDLESDALTRRQGAWGRVTTARRFAAAAVVKDDAVRLFGRWEYGAIWQLARCAGFRADATWIGERLRGPLTRAEILDALDALLALGLLVRDADGIHAVSEDRITPPELPPGLLSDAVRTWHQSHLAGLALAVRELPSTERLVTGLTLAVGPDELGRIRDATIAYARQVASIAADCPQPDQVVQIEVGIFPLTVPYSMVTRSPGAPLVIEPDTSSNGVSGTIAIAGSTGTVVYASPYSSENEPSEPDPSSIMSDPQ